MRGDFAARDTATNKEFESMRKPNFSLRLQPSLMDEARKVAESEGVALNQLINVAVAEKLSVLRTEKLFQERMRRADSAKAPRIPDHAGKENPPLETIQVHPDSKSTGVIGKVYGMATPQFGKKKRRLDRMRGQ